MRFPSIQVGGLEFSGLMASTQSAVARLQEWLTKAPECVVITATSAGVGEQFRVIHDLGAVPNFVAALPEDETIVWATRDDKRLWTEKSIVLRANTAATRVMLTIGKV